MKKIAAPILEISNLCKNDKKQKIDRLNLIMSAGESTAVLYKKDCENNIELLCDILKGVKKTDKGKVFFKSADVTGSKNSFGVVGKKTGFPKNRTVADFAAAPVVKRGLSKKMALLLIKKNCRHLIFRSTAIRLSPRFRIILPNARSCSIRICVRMSLSL